MNQHEIRQKLIDSMKQEAENGVWQSWDDKDSFIVCTAEAVIDPQIEGRLKGVVQVLKGRGDVSIEPYTEEGKEDSGYYIKVTITPRTC